MPVEGVGKGMGGRMRKSRRASSWAMACLAMPLEVARGKDGSGCQRIGE